MASVLLHIRDKWGGGVHDCGGLLWCTFSHPAARGCISAFISVALTLIGVCVLWLCLSLNCHSKPLVSLYDLHSPHSHIDTRLFFIHCTPSGYISPPPTEVQYINN